MSRLEIENSVDSFPDLDFQFEHIDWCDIVEAEENNDVERLELLKRKSIVIRSSLLTTHNSNSNIGDLVQLRIDDQSVAPGPTSFSGILMTPKPPATPPIPKLDPPQSIKTNSNLFHQAVNNRYVRSTLL